MMRMGRASQAKQLRRERRPLECPRLEAHEALELGIYDRARIRAMAAVRLPSDHYGDPLYQQACRDVEAACNGVKQLFAPIESLFDQMFQPRRAAA